ncbi:MAG TPA: serine hydrolase [Phnomibacter sp.]|nr:serine hydrolase [Phnomibacter sp.]
MKKNFYTLWMQKILLLPIFLFTGVIVISQAFSPAVNTRLQQLLDSIQNSATNPVVGGISAVIDVDGLGTWEGVTGYSARNVDAENNLLPGGVTMTKGTVSHMYSVTKTFTAALVLELAREGYFSLEDPVTKYIPFLAFINEELDGSVTLRQLLGHESGWSDYTSEEMTLLAVAAYPEKIFTPYELLSFVHQIAPKGGPRRYSSTNYTTLGAIIEVATGKPVETHFRERFFNPLGLNSMYLSVREAGRPGEVMAAPHDNFYPLNPVFEYLGSPLRFPFGWTNVSALPFTAIHSMAFTGGGIVSNAAEMAKWGNALYGGRAISATSLKTMIESIDDVPDPDGDYLGYGIWTNTRVSATDYFMGHDGRAPGYRSIMYYQPDRKMTISILTNFSGLDTRLGGLSPYDIAKVLYDALPVFIGGNENRKEAKIILCFNGKEIMVDRSAAAGFIKKGAWLGPCENTLTNIKPKISEGGNIMSVFPNPARSSATFNIQVMESGPVNLRVIDQQGKVVALAFSGRMEKGTMQMVTLTTGNLAAGIYTAQLQLASGTVQQKFLVVK